MVVLTSTKIVGRQVHCRCRTIAHPSLWQISKCANVVVHRQNLLQQHILTHFTVNSLFLAQLSINFNLFVNIVISGTYLSVGLFAFGWFQRFGRFVHFNCCIVYEVRYDTLISCNVCIIWIYFVLVIINASLTERGRRGRKTFSVYSAGPVWPCLTCLTCLALFDLFDPVWLCLTCLAPTFI